MLGRYEIPCPNGHITVLLEKTVQQITANLQGLSSVAPRIAFVCSECRTAFRFDYTDWKSAEGIDDPPQNAVPFVCIVTTKCGHEYCGFPVELVAVRTRDGSDEVLQERFHAEFRSWDKTKMLCERDHGGHSAASLGVRFL
jgi:hypothetical protein